MSRPSKGSRLKLLGFDEELIERIQDFREGYFGAPEYRIVAEALEHFMRDRLEAEPDVRKRYEEARKARLAAKEPRLRIVSKAGEQDAG
ncbi:MAG TPA: hypothetical protein VMK31_07035 [Sphingomicrobium sp.]|nr:hypothetical protein [Sphingomicrobium sp.]